MKSSGLFSLYRVRLSCPVNDIVRVGSRMRGNAFRRFHVAGLAERTFFDVPASLVQHDFPDGPVFKNDRFVGFEKLPAFRQALPFVPVRQESEVSYAHQALGQDMEKEAPDELDGVHDGDFDGTLRSVLEGEGDFSVRKVDDSVV